MRFNRNLYKEAFKRGYKAAKRLNETKKLFGSEYERDEQVNAITDNMLMVLCQELGGEDLVEEFYEDNDGYINGDWGPIIDFVHDYYADKSFEEVLSDCEDYYDDALSFGGPTGSSNMNGYGNWEWFERAKPIICKRIAKGIKHI